MHNQRIIIFLSIAIILIATAKAGIWYYSNTLSHQGITYQLTLIDDAPYQVPIGTQINFTAILTLGTEPIIDGIVYFSINENGTPIQVLSNPTDQNGKAYFTFTMPNNSTYIFQASYEAP